MPNYCKGIGGYQLITLPRGTKTGDTVPGIYQQVRAAVDWQRDHQRLPFLIQNFQYTTDRSVAVWGTVISNRSDNWVTFYCGGHFEITFRSDDVLATAGQLFLYKKDESPLTPYSAKQILPTQIARYTQPNQFVDASDVTATILVTDPQADMDAVNLRTFIQVLETRVPTPFSSDAGKILKVGSDGKPHWVTP